MMKPEFARLIQELCLFFGKEEPGPERAQAWYEVIRHLPGGVAGLVTEDVTDTAGDRVEVGRQGLDGGIHAL